MAFRVSRRQVLLALLAGAVVAGTTIAVEHATPGAPPVSISSSLPPVNDEPTIPTDLDSVEAALGPFVHILVPTDTPTPDTHNPAVLELVYNGTTKASTAWQVPFSTTQWTESPVFKIQNLSVNGGGYATFSIGQGRVFTVKCNQAFFFDDTPQLLHVIDPQRTQWTVTSARAIALRQKL